MRFIIFNDGYHDNFVVADIGLTYTMSDFFRVLSEPHSQPYQIAELRWDDLECEESRFLPKTRSLIEKMFISDGEDLFTDTEYDLVWDIADKY